ncbi:MAG: methylisocitrate lyase [Gemmataceae bacterium]|nr:methylisocitrate lyase [Gemmataceae bacterium]
MARKNPSGENWNPGLALRLAWEKETIALPGVFCPLAAKLASRLGFQAAYLSGAQLSASLGLPDVGLVSVKEFTEEAARITAAVKIPLLCDADTGFGEPIQVERCVRLFEQAGAGGIHIEDQLLPKRCGHLSGKELVEASAMAAKIRSAVRARENPSFVIMARTDARGVSGLDDAIARAKTYLDAGADAIFPEALETPGEFETFARQVQAPLLANMTEFGKSPRLKVSDLSQMGYRMVLFPVSGFRAAMLATRKVFEEIRTTGGIEDNLAAMLTRAELYSLLEYQGFEERDRSYFQ